MEECLLLLFFKCTLKDTLTPKSSGGLSSSETRLIDLYLQVRQKTSLIFFLWKFPLSPSEGIGFSNCKFSSNKLRDVPLQNLKQNSETSSTNWMEYQNRSNWYSFLDPAKKQDFLSLQNGRSIKLTITKR